MHRDLKPENILCEDSTDLGEDELHIKLCDFGLSTKYDPDGMRMDGCGSYRYFSPELCRGDGFGPKIDVWAVGCITYMLLAQKYPFYDKSNTRDERVRRNNVKRHIIFGEPNFGEETKNVSPEALEFIRLCFTKDVDQRPSAAQLLESAWMHTL